MIATIALALALALPPKDSWLGTDKVKHFLMSGLVQSAAYSLATLGGAGRRNAQAAGAVAATSVGLWKEFHDRAQKKPFSPRDLAWDAAGALTAAALLNGAR